MNRKKRYGAFLVVALGAVFSLIGRVMATPEPLTFRLARPGYQWSFPRDHGPHNEFQTEWWYYTGQLYREGTEPFRDPPAYGFQLTFFRRAETPRDGARSEYLAHAALTNIATGVTTFSSRKGGALLGAAGANPTTLEVWSGDWLAELIGEKHVLRFTPTRERGTSLRFLGSVKGSPWLQGEGGFSRKGTCESCASHYYSIPRIALSGEVRSEGQLTPVTGLAWMDHEFMTNTLAPDQVGWDWMGLMLKDGRNLTVFRLRAADGSTSYASATIQREGLSVAVRGDEVTLSPGKVWLSPVTGARYPLEWRVQIPRHGIDIIVMARVPSCEVGEGSSQLEPRYWEGPVSAEGESAIGYLEMTGYAGKVRL